MGRHNIRCNAISPGYVLNDQRDADMTPEERTRREAMHLLGLQIEGDEGLQDGEDAIDRGRWQRGFLASFAQTIAAGTSEIQKNIIGERVLGMPRG